MELTLLFFVETSCPSPSLAKRSFFSESSPIVSPLKEVPGLNKAAAENGITVETGKPSSKKGSLKKIASKEKVSQGKSDNTSKDEDSKKQEDSHSKESGKVSKKRKDFSTEHIPLEEDMFKSPALPCEHSASIKISTAEGSNKSKGKVHISFKSMSPSFILYINIIHCVILTYIVTRQMTKISSITDKSPGRLTDDSGVCDVTADKSTTPRHKNSMYGSRTSYIIKLIDREKVGFYQHIDMFDA